MYIVKNDIEFFRLGSGIRVVLAPLFFYPVGEWFKPLLMLDILI